MSIVPARLLGPEPGWTSSADVVVVGSGVAGISVALNARAAGHRVIIVTKGDIHHGSTRWAQGGIAAALDDTDSPAEHIQDTLVAGVGLCDPVAVETLATEGPQAVRHLITLGAIFDTNEVGEIALTREGGHLRDRIAHAGGDATGAEIMRTLIEAVRNTDGIEVIEHALALDLLTDASGAAQGLTLHVMGAGQRDGVGAVLAPRVVLATGGLGQVYSQTTNPPVATGDGVGLALRAGAAVADLEFVQFHPTVMWLGSDAAGQQPLISEAVRGEGAFLVDDQGERFMPELHPLADLAPRDVVAKAVIQRMRTTGADHLWLDGRSFGRDKWAQRFPTILSRCDALGINPAHDLIPVAPAQHYASGGVLTDTWGRTTIPGLFACGEVACTGVHGANRLASNSLLEGLVFADRIGRALAESPGKIRPVRKTTARVGLVPAAGRAQIQQAMMAGAGVLRTGDGLESLIDTLAACDHGDDHPSTESWEATNLFTVAMVLSHAALRRTETRGSHWREDAPERDDHWWQLRQVYRFVDGVLQETDRPIIDAIGHTGTALFEEGP